MYGKFLRSLLNGCQSEKGARFYVDYVGTEKAENDDSTNCYASLISSVISALDDGGEDFNPLEITVYAEANTDAPAYICDVLLTFGGPNIRARYESRWESLEISGAWGCDRFVIHQGMEDHSALKNWIEDVAPCFIS